MDRRSLKTRKALCKGLEELLIEKELRQVTVQEVADKADVNRVTFYKHYLDVYDLYEKIEKEVLSELGILVLELENLPSEDCLARLIGYIDENRTVFKMIFSPNTTGQLRNKLARLMQGIFRQLQSEKQHTELTDSRMDYQNCYRSQGCMAVIGKWVVGDFKEPKEFVIRILSELDGNTEKYISSHH